MNDESTFHAHDGRHMGWTEKGKEPLLPKGKGQGLMVSDFIDEHKGFLQLTEEQHKVAKEEHDRDFQRYAREVLHLGQQNE